ncbi:MAG TPA: hypothetical protein VKQ11_19495 [Candidatus Sulfotelmatobacter sp.]|nr:hypothetical protein [Candidatus Sulfotelmatobacter sp.]
MASIRTFAYAAVLVVTTVVCAPNLVSAQEPAHGKFTLTHNVRWEKAKLPAGNYEFSYDPDAVAPVLKLTKTTGTRAGFMLLVPATEASKPSDLSRLMIESSPEGSYVSAMTLPESGITLLFGAPPHASAGQNTKAAATTSAASGQ